VKDEAPKVAEPTIVVATRQISLLVKAFAFAPASYIQ
jgi:hypothetical protein